MGELEGKSVIVTGGGKDESIGYGVARACAREGASVALVGASTSKLNQARKLEDLYGARIMRLHMPQVQIDAVQSAVSQVNRELGRIDVLVNCLQSARCELLAQSREQDFDETLHQNLVAPYLWMRACYPALKATRGVVINFVSGAAVGGLPALGALAAASGGLQAMSRVAAGEWQDVGICVETIEAQAKTAELERWSREFPEEFEEAREAHFAQGLSSVDDIGRACVRLCARSR